MTKLNILRVTKPYVSYMCEDPYLVSSQGMVNIALRSDVEELDDTYEVFFEFRMRILTLDDKERFDEEINFEEKDHIALFHVKYKVVLDTDLGMEEITKGRMLRLLESYIRKDILDFYHEVGMPYIQLPYELWEEK